MTNLGKLIEAIKTIITEISDEDGWVFLGEVGTNLNKRYPDFDTRNYGYSKLSSFILSLNKFEIQSEKTNKEKHLLELRLKIKCYYRIIR